MYNYFNPQAAIIHVPKAKVTTIQYEDRNVKLRSQGLDNRWIITLDSEEATNHLVNYGLMMLNRYVNVMKYDNVVGKEYEEFLMYQEMVKYI